MRFQIPPISFLKVGVVWPFPATSDLTVLNGQTVTLTPGQTHGYNNITVNAGGVLEIGFDDSGVWTTIACKGTFTLNGELRGRKGRHTAVTANGSALDGKSFSVSVSQPAGGSGGAGGYVNGAQFQGTPVVGAGGGGQVLGNGGGGGSGSGVGQSNSSWSQCIRAGDWATGSGGGNGYSARYTTSVGYTITCAGGAIGSNGGAANHTVMWPSYTEGQAGGGGGGRGFHGAFLYLALKNSIVGTGTINLSGNTGGPGGSGCPGGAHNDGKNTYYFAGGGGGGGGAGGNGGHFRYSAGKLGSVTVNVAAGGGGAGGVGGPANGGGAGAYGGNGQAGGAGSSVAV